MMFGGYFILKIYQGHVYNVDTIVWFPLLLFIYELSIKKNKLIYSVSAAIVSGFILVAGHIQPGYYGFFSATFYFYIRFYFARKKLSKKLFYLPMISAIVGFC